MSRSFDPVHLDAEQHPSSISVTLAGKHSACPRAAFLYLQHGGGASSEEMIRGSAIHEVIDRCLTLMMLEGEGHVPTDVARDIANEVISEGVRLNRETDPVESRVAVPFSSHDYIRMAVYRWAEFFRTDPALIRGVEQMMQLDVGGWVVRGKIDLAVVEDGVLSVTDWKSSRNLPSYDEISIRQPDGRQSPKTTALILYALLARYGNPVEWVECGACDGPVTDPHAMSCEACEGRGGAWRKLPKWPAHERYELSLVFPAVDVGDQLAVRGPLVLEERDLFDFGRALGGHVDLLGSRLESGDWPAVPGSHCSTCPVPLKCPLPRSLRSWQGGFDGLEHAERVAEALYVSKKHNERVHNALRAAASENGWEVVRCGSDRAYTFRSKVAHIGEARERRESTEFRDRAYVPDDEEATA